MNRILLSQRVCLAKEVLSTDLAGECVMLHLGSEEYYSLDAVGTHMLDTLQNSESIKVAYNTLLAEYVVAPEKLQEDLLNLINELSGHGLVKVMAQ